MKKFLALLLALVMTMSLVTVGASAKTAFTDDKDITEVEAVEVLSAMGIIDGYKDGSFKPQGALNRAAGAKFIAYLMLGEKNADGLKATGTVFEDVAADYALAPYVEWCAKMGIVDGYGDGKFGPTNTLTQAAFGKMLLTALGYDSAKEGYTGAGWQKAVYADGLAAGVYGDDGEIFAACDRETAAKLALGALKAEMVEYGRGDKLATVLVKNCKTLNKTAKKLLGDTKVELWMTYDDLKYVADKDAWGRPGHAWTYGNDFDEFYVDEAVATYTVATKNCDIYDALDADKNDELEIVKNGKPGGKYTVADDKDEFGAQGQLVEFYEVEKTVNNETVDTYKVVVIDTYLAKVTSVSELKYDNNDHVKANAKIVMNVYGTGTVGSTLTLTDDEANFEYEEDDYVLVNVKDNTTGDILGKADSVEAAQTHIYLNSAKHEIDGTVYDDAYTFGLNGAKDDAGTKDETKFTWFFDQYGNVIGSAKIFTAKQYATIKDIDWATAKGADYAVATLVYMDATEAADVVVKKLDTLTGSALRTFVANYSDDEETYLADGLFEVETDSNDKVTLTEVGTYKNVDVKAKNSTMLYTDPANNNLKVNDDTDFLVRTGKGTSKSPFVWTAVDGYSKLDDMTGANVVYVAYENGEFAEGNANYNYAKYVYVKGSVDSTKTEAYYFCVDKDAAIDLAVKENKDNAGAVVSYTVTAVCGGFVDMKGETAKLTFTKDYVTGTYTKETAKTTFVDELDTFLQHADNQLYVATMFDGEIDFDTGRAEVCTATGNTCTKSPAEIEKVDYTAVAYNCQAAKATVTGNDLSLGYHVDAETKAFVIEDGKLTTVDATKSASYVYDTYAGGVATEHNYNVYVITKEGKTNALVVFLTKDNVKACDHNAVPTTPAITVSNETVAAVDAATYTEGAAKTVTVSAKTGYTLTSVKYAGNAIALEGDGTAKVTIPATATGNVVIEVAAEAVGIDFTATGVTSGMTFDVVVTDAEGNALTAGTDKLTYGETYTITATAQVAKRIAKPRTITINDTEVASTFTNGVTEALDTSVDFTEVQMNQAIALGDKTAADFKQIDTDRYQIITAAAAPAVVTFEYTVDAISDIAIALVTSAAV